MKACLVKDLLKYTSSDILKTPSNWTRLQASAIFRAFFKWHLNCKSSIIVHTLIQLPRLTYRHKQFWLHQKDEEKNCHRLNNDLLDFFLHRPGAYEFDAKRDRKVKFHGSFGGPQTLITSVTIKCNDFGEPDIVSINLIVELTELRLLHCFGGYRKLDTAN